MNVEALQKVYVCFIAAGFAIALFQVVAGGLGGALGLDFDLDGDTGDGPFPGAVMSLSLFAVLFGAVGRLMLGFAAPWAGIAAGIASGAAGAFALSRFVIRPLRRNRCDALRMETLRWKVGRVKLEIRSDFAGKVALLSSTGSLITYSAKPIHGVERIAVGEEVMVVEVDAEKRVCTVSPMKKHPTLGGD